MRAPPPSSEAVARVMRGNVSRNTRPERAVRGALVALGVSDFKVNYDVHGHEVDIAFPKTRVALFVHGCFWHGCPICRIPVPRSHSRYWETKIRGNRIRDRTTTNTLRRSGWSVEVIWEHEFTEGVEWRSLLRKIERPSFVE